MKQGSRFSDFECAADFNFRITLKSVKNYLSSSHSTAVNLLWALERMNTVCVEHKSEPIKDIQEALLSDDDQQSVTCSGAAKTRVEFRVP